MNFYIFTISLYKTCTIVALLILVIRMTWIKNILQKYKITRNDYIAIIIIFSILGIISIFLPYKKYGTVTSTIKVLIVSGGILFGPIVSMSLSIIMSIILFIIDYKNSIIIFNIIGILTSGVVSSIAYKIIKIRNIKSNRRWLVGIVAGIIAQMLTLLQSQIYISLFESVIYINELDVYISIAITQIPIGIFISIIQDITEERQIANLEQLKSELNKTKLEILQSQINPHFLFNTLNVIGLLTEDEPKKAREIITMLSSYIRHNLELNGDFITIYEEIDHIKCYIYIQQTRFEDKFDISYDIGEDIDIKIPSLIIQPLVENALEHGILSTNRKGQIYVVAKQIMKNRLYISIENTGKSISEEVIKSLYNDSLDRSKIGLRNVHKRLQTIYGEGLIIKSLGEGTKIEFYIGGEYEGNNSRG